MRVADPNPNAHLAKRRKHGDPEASEKVLKRDRELLELALQHEDELSDEELVSFVNIAEKLRSGRRTLTPRQRAWVEATLSRLDVPTPAENLVSNGQVPPEREPVELAPALRKLPLAPPGRKQEWRDQ